MKRFQPLAVVFLLLIGSLQAADITIVGPTKPIQIGRATKLMINGVTDVELLGTDVKVIVPDPVSPDDVDLEPAKTFSNLPYVRFTAWQPGRYLVEVRVNYWSDLFTKAVDAATQAKIDANDLKEIQVNVTKITSKYPAKSGSCIVEVAGTVPTPPPPPPPPPDDVSPPSLDLQSLVAPLTATLRSNKDKAAKLKEAYLGMEEVVLKDGGVNINSTASLMEWHRATLLKIPRGSDPPAVGIAIDDAIAKHLGIAKSSAGYANVALSPQQVSQLADVLHAVAWASAQAAK